MISKSQVTYMGSTFTYSNVNTILSNIWKMLEDDGRSISCIKRIYSITNECLENICKHSLTETLVTDCIKFSIVKNNEMYIIEATNPISPENGDRLKKYVTKLNNMEENDLKNLYQEGIKQSQITDKGGAGLGLIIIARKSEKLDLSITKIDEKMSLATFLIAVSA